MRILPIVAFPLACTLALLGPLPASTAAQSERPNIVLIVADDLGWRDVGYHGSEIRTPNIDSLASRGVVLERFYAYPMCNPTRIALMTGRNAVEISAGASARNTLPLDERILPQIFKDAGYQTFMMGKWHLGLSHVDYFPHNRGFDHFYGFLNAGLDYFTRIIRGGLDWQRNGKSVREEGYTTELLTDEAVRLLRRRDKSAPTLLYLCYNASHTPLQVPESHLGQYSEIEDEDRRIYAAMTTALDTGIGRVLATLDEEKMTRNTFVVFMSDNGGGRAADNSPLRGGKGSTFEGGVRVPAVIWWPGIVEGGRKTDQVVTVHDWLPTLASAANVPLGKTKPIYGQDLWPALRDGKVVAHKDFLLGTRGNLALYHEDWKIVRSSTRGSTERQTLLFRINEDPYEKNDLSAAHPDVFGELTARLDAAPGRPAVADRGRRPAARRPAGAPPAPGQPRGRRPGADQFRAETEETREPYAEAAARN